MSITQLHVEGYRSVRRVFLRLNRINVLVGPNGCGKSNLYRSIYLIACAANGQFARTLAQEGGIPSVLWAGKRHKLDKPRLRLAIWVDRLKYELICARMPHSERLDALQCFENDPDIKEEEVTFVQNGKSTSLVKRKRGLITARNRQGRRVEYPLAVTESESILSGLREPENYPELFSLRQEFLNWRFYHQFRTDAASPLRQPQIGVLTPVMAHDGSDVAAALATIYGVGDAEALDAAIEEAFPGSRLSINSNFGQFSISMHMPGFNRPFEALELSDGTLQYLCLLAALLSPRPPSLMALNEPETSIHPDLYESLAKLIVRTSRDSQMWITTHSRGLSDFILEHGGYAPLELEKVEGETRLIGVGLDGDRDDEEDESGDDD